MQKFIKPAEMDWTKGKVRGFDAKNLLDLQNGSVKLVRVSPQSEYPIHLHPDKTEYIFVLKGSVSCKVGSEKISVSANEFLIFPENMEHNISNPLTDQALLLVGAVRSDKSGQNPNPEASHQQTQKF
jgi:mannose-6-phosphate isomerase-like protein (cupin superfamily)